MLTLYSNLDCLWHRGGFGSMQRLVQEFMPPCGVAFVDDPRLADAALLWDDGRLMPEAAASVRSSVKSGRVAVYLSSNYLRCQGGDTYNRQFNLRSRSLAASADLLVHVSLAHRRAFVEYVCGGDRSISEKPWCVLPPMYDQRYFRPRPFRGGTARDREPIVVAVALWRDWFRWLGIFEAFAIVARRRRDARLVLGGAWASRVVIATQRDVARELGIRNRLACLSCESTSFQEEQERLGNVYRRGSVFLHTRHADWGTMTCVEAMACGLPIVAGDCGGLPELAGPAGYFAPGHLDYQASVMHPLDAAKLADLVETAWADSEASKRAIKQAERYSAETVLGGFVDVLKHWIG